MSIKERNNAAQRIRRAISKAYPKTWHRVSCAASKVYVSYANGPVHDEMARFVAERACGVPVEVTRQYTFMAYWEAADKLGVEKNMSRAQLNYSSWMISGKPEMGSFAKKASDHLEVLRVLGEKDLTEKTE